MANKIKQGEVKVFLVAGNETQSGYHEVYVSKTGNMNAVKPKRFIKYDEAAEYAKKEGEKIGGKTILSGYMKNKNAVINYPVKEKSKKQSIEKCRSIRITPKRKRLPR